MTMYNTLSFSLIMWERNRGKPIEKLKKALRLVYVADGIGYVVEGE